MANFDITTDKSRQLFLTYDQEKMISHYNLKHDEKYLYFWYLSRIYRIGREDGYVEGLTVLVPKETFAGMDVAQIREISSGAEESDAAGTESVEKENSGDLPEYPTEFLTECSKNKWVRTTNELTMTFYDIFCYGKENAAATGEFINLNSLVTMVSAAGNPGKGLFSGYGSSMDKESDKLEKALIRLGGRPEGKGDIAYQLPLFEFMDIRFQLWHADEDFPAEVQSFVDTGILTYMHYETVWYMMNNFLRRIKEEMAAG